MQTQVEHMIKKLDHMSPDRLAEINDFIDFLWMRALDSKLHQEFTKASENSFSKVWENEDDTAYDSI